MSREVPNDPDDSGPARHLRRIHVAALHIFALSGFAVAQPIFDVLSRNPTYLVAHGLSRWTVLAFTVGLILVPPVVALGTVSLIGLFSPRAGDVVQTAFVGALFALTVCSPLTRERPGPVPLVLYIAVAILASLAYTRLNPVARYLTWLAPAPLLFALGFLVFGPASAYFRAPAPQVSADPVGDEGTPSVVHLVLDELSLGALLEPDGTIDGRRFPNFAQLAKTSTWYRDATTNSNATRHAVPAALTGRYPKSGHRIPPTESVYPQNLFSLLGPTHSLESGETVTALCSVDRCRRRSSAASATKHLLADTALVYLHGTMPPIVKAYLPTLPERQWAGFFADPLMVEERTRAIPAAARPVARWVLTALADRDVTPYSPEIQRVNAFLASVPASTQPALRFHHALLPHEPWHLTAEGVPYDSQSVPGFVNGRWHSQALADQTLQRYLLQLKAVDGLMGRVVSRLRSEGLWDETMLVVHGDHGIAFTKDIYYRAIKGAEGEVARVPLFVKYPGQHEAKIDDRNVELIDIVPTIADALDIPLPWKVDGKSLLRPGERRYKRLWSGIAPGVPLPPYRDMEPSKTPMQIRALFGRARPTADDLYAFGPHRDLVGRVPGRQRTATEHVALDVERPERFNTVDLEGPFSPARIVGSFEGGSGQDWIAVALNGRIAGLGHIVRAGSTSHFAVMLSPRYFQNGKNDLAFYFIDSEGTLIRLG